jgi:hypothetical protein
MNIDAPVSESYCSIHSLKNREPLIGSAPRTDFWILLEYAHPMSQKALKENLLPDEINAYLASLQSTITNSRILLIRQRRPAGDSSLALYLADGREGNGFLHKLALARYTDLLKIDVASIFSRGNESPASSGNDRILLVCTNGKRDACCSKWGVALFDTLEKQYSEQVWQSSHLGGHRFAPNLVCLPHGVCYGRVPLDEVTSIADRYLSGRLSLDFYRGLAAYPPPAQAAEYFLRLETRDDHIGSYHLERITPTSEHRWEIVFSDLQAMTTYRVNIETFQTEKEIFESCSKPDERKAVWEFRLQRPIQES